MNQSEQQRETPKEEKKPPARRHGGRKSESEWMRTMSAIAFGLCVLFAALVAWEFFGAARPALCLMFLIFSAVCFVTAALFYHWKRAIDRENATRDQSREEREQP